jgi:two-component sensor histidine kinase
MLDVEHRYGYYISQIASAVMHTYGVDGIRLDLKVDHALASINVGMPVVNELMTNECAFAGRGTGTVTFRCLHQDEANNRIVVADKRTQAPQQS